MNSVHIVLSLFLITSTQFVCLTSAAKKKDDGCNEVGCFPPKSAIPRGKHIPCSLLIKSQIVLLTTLSRVRIHFKRILVNYTCSSSAKMDNLALLTEVDK